MSQIDEPPSTAMHSARERRERIRRLVEEEERVSVADLTQRFGVTDTSIRRDLKLLEGEGRLKRMHGGAVATRRSPRAGVYRAKEREHLAEKRRIGEAAAALVRSGDVVLFDSGTTVAQAAAQIAPSLRGRERHHRSHPLPTGDRGAWVVARAPPRLPRGLVPAELSGLRGSPNAGEPARALC